MTAFLQVRRRQPRRRGALGAPRPHVAGRLGHGDGAAAARRRDDPRARTSHALRDVVERARRRVQGHADDRPHARRARRADDVRPQARGLGRRGPARRRRASPKRRRRSPYGKISGAVGTHATVPPEVEEKVCAHLGLMVEPVSTQVVPRDRHAFFMTTLAVIAASLERFATEMRAPAAHRGARSRGAVQRGPDRLQRDAAQAQPGAVRAHLRPRARRCAATPSRRSRTSRSGTSATSRTRRPSASSSPTPACCSTTCSTSSRASCAG